MENKVFVNLHVHSDIGSIQDSIASPEDLVLKAKELGMDSIALTDHGSLAGWLKFKNACTKHNIKPIFGVEGYFVDDVQDIFRNNEKLKELEEVAKELRKEKKPNKSEKMILNKTMETIEELRDIRKHLKKYNHLILLAKNYEGMQNIMRIHNDAVIDGYYFKNRFDWQVLEKHKGGIIATTACLGGRISKLLEIDDFPKAIDTVARFKNIFGENNFYLELQLHDLKLQTDINHKLIQLSERTNTPLSISTDAHYTEEGQQAKTRALIRQLDKEPDEINDDDTLTDLYIKNEDMLLTAWRKYMIGVPLKYLSEAINNTRKIANSIEIFEFDNSLKFPTFETGDLTQEEYLTQKAFEGLKRKGLHENQKYINRLQFELDTINPLGFASYFNVVADMVNEAKKSQSVGIARGCISPETQIHTTKGLKNISDIKINDICFNHIGETGIVTNTYCYENTETMYKITPYNSDSMCLTDDHLVWTKINKNTIPTWIPAKLLTTNNLVYSPKLQHDVSNSHHNYIDLNNYGASFYNEHMSSLIVRSGVESKHKNLSERKVANALNIKVSHVRAIYRGKINKNIKLNDINKIKNYFEKNGFNFDQVELPWKKKYIFNRKIHIDNDFMYFLGTFTGDGWIRKKYQQFGFSFNTEDIQIIKTIKTFLDKNQFTYSEYIILDKKSYTIYIWNNALLNLLKSLFNKYECSSNTKHVPEFIFNLSNESLILSYLYGYRDSDGTHNSKYEQIAFSYKTNSQFLIREIPYLFSLLNLPCKTLLDTHIENREKFKNSKAAYCIRSPYPDKINKNKFIYYENDGKWIQIRKITKEYHSKVYDICIDNKHSYTGAFAVHNSGGGSLAGYCVGITEVDPIEHELFFERFLDSRKGLLAPTFGIGKKLFDTKIDYLAIEKDCNCGKKH